MAGCRRRPARLPLSTVAATFAFFICLSALVHVSSVVVHNFDDGQAYRRLTSFASPRTGQTPQCGAYSDGSDSTGHSSDISDGSGAGGSELTSPCSLGEFQSAGEGSDCQPLLLLRSGSADWSSAVAVVVHEGEAAELQLVLAAPPADGLYRAGAPDDGSADSDDAVVAEVRLITDSEGSVYPVPASVALHANNWSTPVPISIRSTDDDAVGLSPSRAVAVSLEMGFRDTDGTVLCDAAPVGASELSVTALDDDSSGIRGTVVSAGFSLAQSPEASEGFLEGATWGLKLNFTSRPHEPVVIRLSWIGQSHDGAFVPGVLTRPLSHVPDVLFEPSTVVVQPDEWASGVSVIGRGVDDAFPRGQVVGAIVATLTSQDLEYDIRTETLGYALKIDNDIASVELRAVDPSQTTTAEEGVLRVREGNSVALRVRLTSRPTSTVSVVLTVPSGLVVSRSSVAFGLSQWRSFATIDATAVEDRTDFGERLVEVRGRCVSEDATFDGIEASLSLVLVDDDVAGLVFASTLSSTTGQSGQETISLAVTEGGRTEYAVWLGSHPVSSSLLVRLHWTPEAKLVVPRQVLSFDGNTWSVPQIVQVDASDNDVAEGPALVSLRHEVVAPEPGDRYATATDVSIDVSVAEDDEAGLHLSVEHVDLLEGSANVVGYHAVLTSQPVGSVTVTLERGASHYVLQPSILVFEAEEGHWKVPRLVNVVVLDDEVPNGARNSTIMHKITSASDATYSSLPDSVLPVVTGDDDAPGIFLSPVRLAVAEGSTVSYQVQLLAVPQSDVTIQVVLSGERAVASSAAPSLIVFDEDNWDSPVAIGVTVGDDDRTDLSGHVSIAHEVDTDDDNYATAAVPAPVVLTVTDDDVPGVNFVNSSVSVREGKSASYGIRLMSRPQAVVFISIDVVMDSDADIMASVAQLAFEPSSWNTVQIVELAAADDDAATGNFGGFVRHDILSEDLHFAGIVADNVEIAFVDDDTPGVLLVGAEDLHLKEDEFSASHFDTFSVVLAARPAHDVFVQLTSGPAVSVPTAAMSFTPSSWNTPQLVLVAAVDDDVDDQVDQKRERVTLSVSSADAGYDALRDVVVDVVVDDNDHAGFAVSLSALCLLEDESATLENDSVEHCAVGTVMYTVRLTSQPFAEADSTGAVTLFVDVPSGYCAAFGQEDQPVDVRLCSSDVECELGAFCVVDSAVVAAPRVLTFTNDDWSTPKAVHLTVVNDNIDEDALMCSVVRHIVSSTTDAAYWGAESEGLVSTVHCNAAASFEQSKSSGVTLVPASAVAVIDIALVDNDRAGLLISSNAEPLEDDGSLAIQLFEGGDAVTVSLQLLSRPLSAVTVSVTSSNDNGDVGDQFSSAPGSPLVFTPYTWQRTQDIRISAVDDFVDEAVPHLADIRFTSEASDARYSAASISASWKSPSTSADDVSLVVSIVDNDWSGVELVAAPEGYSCISSDPRYSDEFCTSSCPDDVVCDPSECLCAMRSGGGPLVDIGERNATVFLRLATKPTATVDIWMLFANNPDLWESVVEACPEAISAPDQGDADDAPVISLHHTGLVCRTPDRTDCRESAAPRSDGRLSIITDEWNEYHVVTIDASFQGVVPVEAGLQFPLTLASSSLDDNYDGSTLRDGSCSRSGLHAIPNDALHAEYARGAASVFGPPPSAGECPRTGLPETSVHVLATAFEEAPVVMHAILRDSTATIDVDFDRTVAHSTTDFPCGELLGLSDSRPVDDCSFDDGIGALLVSELGRGSWCSFIAPGTLRVRLGSRSIVRPGQWLQLRPRSIARWSHSRTFAVGSVQIEGADSVAGSLGASISGPDTLGACEDAVLWAVPSSEGTFGGRTRKYRWSVHNTSDSDVANTLAGNPTASTTSRAANFTRLLDDANAGDGQASIRLAHGVFLENATYEFAVSTQIPALAEEWGPHATHLVTVGGCRNPAARALGPRVRFVGALDTVTLEVAAWIPSCEPSKQQAAGATGEVLVAWRDANGTDLSLTAGATQFVRPGIYGIELNSTVLWPAAENLTGNTRNIVAVVSADPIVALGLNATGLNSTNSSSNATNPACQEFETEVSFSLHAEDVYSRFTVHIPGGKARLVNMDDPPALEAVVSPSLASVRAQLNWTCVVEQAEEWATGTPCDGVSADQGQLPEGTVLKHTAIARIGSHEAEDSVYWHIADETVLDVSSHISGSLERTITIGAPAAIVAESLLVDALYQWQPTSDKSIVGENATAVNALLFSDGNRADQILAAAPTRPVVPLMMQRLTCGASYGFRVSVVDSATGLSAWTAVRVRINTPPHGGLFSVFPDVGVALETVFRLSLLEWVDEDGDLPLRFSFGVRLNSGPAVALYAPSHANSIESLMPNASDVSLAGTVYDTLGARVTTTTHVNVTIAPITVDAVRSAVFLVARGLEGHVESELRELAALWTTSEPAIATVFGIVAAAQQNHAAELSVVERVTQLLKEIVLVAVQTIEHVGEETCGIILGTTELLAGDIRSKYGYPSDPPPTALLELREVATTAADMCVGLNNAVTASVDVDIWWASFRLVVVRDVAAHVGLWRSGLGDIDGSHLVTIPPTLSLDIQDNGVSSDESVLLFLRLRSVDEGQAPWSHFNSSVATEEVEFSVFHGGTAELLQLPSIMKLTQPLLVTLPSSTGQQYFGDESESIQCFASSFEEGPRPTHCVRTPSSTNSNNVQCGCLGLMSWVGVWAVTPGINIDVESELVVYESGGNTTEFFNVSLTTAPLDSTVTVAIRAPSTTCVVVAGDGSQQTAVCNSGISCPATASCVTNSTILLEPSELVFSPADWDQGQTVTLTASNDDSVESSPATVDIVHTVMSEDVRFDTSGRQACVEFEQNSFSCTARVSGPRQTVVAEVHDDDEAGVSLNHQSITVREGEPTGANYSVSLHSRPWQPVSIEVFEFDQVSVVSGGVEIPTTLVFDSTDWRSPHVVVVTAVDDEVDESFVEDAAVGNLTHTVASPDLTYNQQELGHVSVRVLDDDSAGILLSGVFVNVSEGAPAGGSYVDITLQSQPTGPVTVAFSTETSPHAQRLTISPTVLEFSAALWDTSQRVILTAADDQVSQETVQLQVVYTVDSADTAYSLLSGGEPGITVTVTDDDVAGLVIDVDNSPLELAEGGPSGSYRVRLASQPVANVIVRVSMGSIPDVEEQSSSSFSGYADGETDVESDDQVESANERQQLLVSVSTLAFSAADWDEDQVVSLSAIDDDVDEDDMEISLLHVLDTTDSQYRRAGPIAGVVQIRVIDDDTAGIDVPSTLGILEGGNPASYSVVLLSEPVSDVQVTISPVIETQFTLSQHTLVFRGGAGQPAWWEPQEIQVTAVDDAIDEDPVLTFYLTHSMTTDDAKYRAVVPPTLALTLTDDDGSAIFVSESTINLVEGEQASYTMRLDSQPTRDVHVMLVLSTEARSQIQVEPDTITLTASSWNQENAISVTAIDDNVKEGATVAYQIDHQVSSGQATYDGIPVQSVVIRVDDNDAAGIELSHSVVQLLEGGAAAQVAVRLRSSPKLSVFVTVAPASARLRADTSVLVFEPSTWAEWRTVQLWATQNEETGVPQIADYLNFAAASEDPDYRISAGAVRVTAIITDDDNTAPVADAGVDTIATYLIDGTYVDPIPDPMSPRRHVVLDGSRSVDSDGFKLRYEWNLVEAPAGAPASRLSTLTIHDRFAPVANVSGIVYPGLYRFRLTVTDVLNLTSSDDVAVWAPGLSKSPYPAAGKFCVLGQVCVVEWLFAGLPGDSGQNAFVSLALYDGDSPVDVIFHAAAGEDDETAGTVGAHRSAAWSVPFHLPDGDNYHLRVRFEMEFPGADPPFYSFLAEGAAFAVQRRFRWVPASWGPCSASCNTGSRTRALSCLDTSGRVVTDRLCAATNKPATTEPCFERPCGSVAWHAGAWGECSHVCGGGIQRRTVQCKNATHTVRDSECETASGVGARPVSTSACNSRGCESSRWQFTEWRPCSRTCGGGVQYRNAFCIGDGGAVVSASNCEATRVGITERECGLQTCTSYNFIAGDWDRCSASCGRGKTSRAVTCVRDTDLAHMPLRFCAAAVSQESGIIEEVAVERTCNERACSVISVETGTWGSCEGAASSCNGTRTRDVVCRSGDDGDVVTRRTCIDAGLTIPPSEESCIPDTAPAEVQLGCRAIDGLCDPSNPHACSGRGVCEISSSAVGTEAARLGDVFGGSAPRECRCASPFEGEQCQTSPECGVGRFLDNNNTCCIGIITPDGTCCPHATAKLDASGKCCASGVLDACGVCNGKAIAVDAAGACCAGVIDASGLCCNGELDACGVCEGMGESCALEVVLTVARPAVVTDAAIVDVTSAMYVALEREIELALTLMLDREVSVVSILPTAGRRRLLSQRTQDLPERHLLAGDLLVTSVVSPSEEFSGGVLEHYEVRELLVGGTGAGASVIVTSVTSVKATGRCGNGVCEFGERCDSRLFGEHCCADDCAFPVGSCPSSSLISIDDGAHDDAVADAALQCNGHGKCVLGRSGQGTCHCFEMMGYIGTSCEECAPGAISIAGECRFLGTTSCSDGLRNGAETGVDCGGLCPSECPSAQPGPSTLEDPVVLAAMASGGTFLLAAFTISALWCYCERKRKERKRRADQAATLTLAAARLPRPVAGARADRPLRHGGSNRTVTAAADISVDIPGSPKGNQLEHLRAARGLPHTRSDDHLKRLRPAPARDSGVGGSFRESPKSAAPRRPRGPSGGDDVVAGFDLSGDVGAADFSGPAPDDAEPPGTDRPERRRVDAGGGVWVDAASTVVDRQFTRDDGSDDDLSLRSLTTAGITTVLQRASSRPGQDRDRPGSRVDYRGRESVGPVSVLTELPEVSFNRTQSLEERSRNLSRGESGLHDIERSDSRRSEADFPTWYDTQRTRDSDHTRGRGADDFRLQSTPPRGDRERFVLDSDGDDGSEITGPDFTQTREDGESARDRNRPLRLPSSNTLLSPLALGVGERWAPVAEDEADPPGDVTPSLAPPPPPRVQGSMVRRHRHAARARAAPSPSPRGSGSGGESLMESGQDTADRHSSTLGRSDGDWKEVSATRGGVTPSAGASEAKDASERATESTYMGQAEAKEGVNAGGAGAAATRAARRDAPVARDGAAADAEAAGSPGAGGKPLSIPRAAGRPDAPGAAQTPVVGVLSPASTAQSGRSDAKPRRWSADTGGSPGSFENGDEATWFPRHDYDSAGTSEGSFSDDESVRDRRLSQLSATDRRKRGRLSVDSEFWGEGTSVASTDTGTSFPHGVGYFGYDKGRSDSMRRPMHRRALSGAGGAGARAAGGGAAAGDDDDGSATPAAAEGAAKGATKPATAASEASSPSAEPTAES